MPSQCLPSGRPGRWTERGGAGPRPGRWSLPLLPPQIGRRPGPSRELRPGSVLPMAAAACSPGDVEGTSLTRRLWPCRNRSCSSGTSRTQPCSWPLRTHYLWARRTPRHLGACTPRGSGRSARPRHGHCSTAHSHRSHSRRPAGPSCLRTEGDRLSGTSAGQGEASPHSALAVVLRRCGRDTRDLLALRFHPRSDPGLGVVLRLSSLISRLGGLTRGFSGPHPPGPGGNRGRPRESKSLLGTVKVSTERGDLLARGPAGEMV